MNSNGNKELKILIPVWNFGKSGGERVLAKLANHFNSSGCKVAMLSYYNMPDPYFPIECPIIYVDKYGKQREQSSKEGESPISSSEKIKALRKGIDSLSAEYNIAIANYSLTAYSVSKSKIKNKFYYIQAYEAFDEIAKRGMRGRIKNSYIKRSYSLPLVRIVNAEIYRDYKEIKAEYVVPPGLDLDVYYSKNSRWQEDKPFVIGCIGRKEKWKGTDDVAKAVEILQKKNANVHFKIAFNEPNYGKYELVKPDGDENLSDYYRSLDVMVAPGTVQLGAVHYPVIEAMACGTPVITTGYYPADNNNSYIVPVNSPESIASTIEHIMENYEEALKKAEIAKQIVGEFRWDIVGNKMLGIISNNIR